MRRQFKDILRELRIEKGKTQEEIANELNTTRQAISNYEKGKRNPDLPVMENIADYFNVDLEYLTGRQSIKSKTSIESYYKDEKLSVSITNKVPLIGQIAAGSPILAEENIEEYFSIDDSVKCDFCLRVKGDSMIDESILDGDIVFIKQQPTVENGEIAAVIIDGEATLKRVFVDDRSLILQPANSKYKPIIVTGGEVIIAGKLVAVLNLRA